MEKYTVSRELAQKLKEAGYPQEAEHHWCYEFDVNNYKTGEKVVYHKDWLWYHDTQDMAICAAPLSDELLEQLPRSIPSKIYDGKKAELWLRKDDGKYFVWYYVTGIEDVESDFGAHADMPANALAKLWLWAKANGHLKPKNF